MEITIMGLILHLLAIWIWINPKIILGDASNHDEFINDNLVIKIMVVSQNWNKNKH